MNVLTDNFDMALQITEEATRRIVQSQHQAGVIYHKYARVYGDKRIDLVINNPTVTFSPFFAPNQPAKALVTSRVFYHSRLLRDAYDLGRGAVADVTICATFELTSGDPGLLDQNARVKIDWGETQRDDIVVYNVPSDFENEVKDTLLEFIKDVRRLYPIPPIGSAENRIGSLAFRFTTFDSGNTLNVGMNVGNVIKGSKTGLTTKFVQKDWAIALCDTYFVSELRKKLQALLPLPYRIFRKCTFRTFWGSCWNWTSVYLTSLDVSLVWGKIKITGHLNIKNSGALVPDASANFTTYCTLSIGSGQTLELSLVDVSASVEGVLGWVFGDYFKNKVRDGVRSALQSGTSESVTDFISSETLNSLAAAGRQVDLDIQVRATSVAIRPDAVIIHGDITTPQPEDAPVVVSFDTIDVNGDPLHKILHAGASRVPGGTITKYRWKHFDGTTDVFSGTNARFVIEHIYDLTDEQLRTLDHISCLFVTDNLGRETTNCFIVLPPSVLELIAESRIRDRVHEGMFPPIFDPRVDAPPRPEPPWPELISQRRLWAIIQGQLGPIIQGQLGPKIQERLWGMLQGQLGPIIQGQLGPIVIDRDLILSQSQMQDKCSLTFRILWGHNSVQDVLIKATALDWSAEAYTDNEGRVTLEIDPSKLRISKSVEKSSNKWFVDKYAHSKILLEASKKGFESTCLHLWIADKSDRTSLVEQLQKRIDDLDLRLRERVSGELLTLTLKSASEIADFKLRKSVSNLVVALENLRKVTEAIAHGSGLGFIKSILKIQESEHVLEAIAQRISETFTFIEDAIKGLPKEDIEKRKTES